MQKFPIALLGVALLLGAGCATKNADTTNTSQSSIDETTMEQPTPMAQTTCTVIPQPPTPDRVTTPFDGELLPDEEVQKKLVRIETAKGNIVFELLPDEGPCAVSNFVTLVKQGFYDGLTFHRVEPGFVVQGGDPLGNGTGGPGYRFSDDQVNLPYERGIVAMANTGMATTNGSQFFIMLNDTPLPPQYSIFGRVMSGQEVVEQIAIGDVMESVTLDDIK